MQFAEAVTDRGRKYADTSRYLLGWSVTLMTLLLPLSILSSLSSATRLFLAAAVLLLLVSTACGVWTLIEDVRGADGKVRQLQAEAKRQAVEGLPPRPLVGRPIARRLYILLTTSIICFGSVILALSGALFQILLS